MADLIAFQTYHLRHSFLSPSTMIPRSSNHKRSLSSGNRSLSPDRTVTKAKSTTDLSGIGAEKPNHVIRSSSEGNFPESGFSTLKDPRLVNSSEVSESSSLQSHHPDLSNEVAALSVKLVQAINNQTTLDDTLVATRQELEQAQSRIKSLESENDKYRLDIDQKVLIKKADADSEIARLKAALTEEKAQRAVVEKGKKTMEQELETLTAALFEEANKMVAAAKLEREAVEKKNEQLRSQIKDTELLLASHQEQLAELKSVMQEMNISKEEVEIRTTTSTAPSSPAGPQQPLGNVGKSIKTPEVSEPTSQLGEIVPGPSTSFPHLIKSVCRTDILAYEDFQELFTLSKASKPPSRATSGSYTGYNVMSLASFGASGFGSASSSPAKSTHSPNGSMSSPQPTSSHIPLKETRFYKRVLMEDIEPTLRLDAAPGISWLARRTVLSSICEGSLLVEPMPPPIKKFQLPCSLCGERRPGDNNERTHRFMTSDSETAQRHPLCVLCLEKVRSSCEFTGYLRLILDGHIRVGDIEEEKDTWEETVRLRERMFWSRIGGGIIPIFSQTRSLGEGFLSTTETVISHHKENQHDISFDPCETSNGISVQTNHKHHTDNEKPTDNDHDNSSVSVDPFVSAAASPNSVTASVPCDTTPPHNRDLIYNEVSGSVVEQVLTINDGSKSTILVESLVSQTTVHSDDQ